MSSPRLARLVDPAHTAVILQELQNGVVGADAPFADLAAAVAETGVVERASQLVEGARRAGVPVVHTTAENLPGGFGVNVNARLFLGARAAGAGNAPGTESVRPLAELHRDGDLVLPRYHGLSPLTGGPLDSLLRNQGISTLVIAGVSLNVAIPNLVFDAVNRSYQVVVVTDAVAATPVSYGAEVLEHTLKFLATLAPAADLVDAWSAAPNEVGPDTVDRSTDSAGDG